MPPTASSVLQFDFAADFSEGLAMVRRGDRSLYIDLTGDIALEPDSGFDGVSAFSEDLALIRANNNYGYIDRSGQVAIDPQ